MKIENNVLIETTQEDIVKGTITVPEGVKQISSLAFFFLRNNKNHGFNKLVLPGSLKKVVKNEVFGNKNLEEVVLSEGITEISEDAFSFSKFKTIKLPSTLKTIKDYAFRYSGITSIDCPPNVTSIGEKAFESSGNLKSVKLSESLNKLGERAFASTKNLKKIEFKANSPIKEIAPKVFDGCAVEKLVLPNSVKSFGYSGQTSASNLKALELNQGLEKLYLAVGKPNKGPTKISLPSSVKNATFSLKKSYTLKFNLQDGNVFDVNVKGGGSTDIYSGIKDIMAVTVRNERSYVIDGSKVVPILDDELYRIKDQHKLINEKMLDRFYVFMQKLKQEYGGEIKNYPTAVEIINIPLNKIKNFTTNRKLFNEINKNVGNKRHSSIIEETFLRIMLELGILDTDPGIKNKIITFARGHLFKYEVMEKMPDFSPLAKKDDYEYNAKRFNMVQSIMKEKLDLEGKLSAIEIGLKNFDDLIKFKRNITSKDLIDFAVAKKYGSGASKNMELARIASVAGLDEEEFEKLSKMVGRSKKSQISGFLTYLQNKTDDVKIKQQKLSDSILDEVKDKFDFEWLTKDNEYSAMLGYICDSCAIIDGDAHGLLRASISPKYPVQNLVVKNQNGSIIGKSTAYLDIDKGVLMFNNVELNWNFENKSNATDRMLVLKAFKRGVDAMIQNYNAVVEGTNITKITKAYMGAANNDLINELRYSYKEVPEEELYKDAKFGGYKTDTKKQYDFYPEGNEK